LSAHNMTVSASAYTREPSGYVHEDPMGAALRKIYGDQMVVFGLAFNEGSFRARDNRTGMMRNFTVPAAPPDSLDATLAAAGIPLFALDLRQAPNSGPVPDWLSVPHKTRTSVGGYCD